MNRTGEHSNGSTRTKTEASIDVTNSDAFEISVYAFPRSGFENFDDPTAERKGV